MQVPRASDVHPDGRQRVGRRSGQPLAHRGYMHEPAQAAAVPHNCRDAGKAVVRCRRRSGLRPELSRQLCCTVARRQAAASLQAASLQGQATRMRAKLVYSKLGRNAVQAAALEPAPVAQVGIIVCKLTDYNRAGNAAAPLQTATYFKLHYVVVPELCLSLPPLPAL
eukprot:355810-Chlamydomonas_euryale.AAC.1